MYKSISPRVVCIVTLLVYIANAYILGNDRVAGRNSWLCVLLSAILYSGVPVVSIPCEKVSGPQFL